MASHVLSIRQPWAWLIVNGYKDIENRSWPTNYRGPLLIHAGQAPDREGYEWIRYAFPDIPMPMLQDMERGGIVGRAELVGCVKDHPSAWFSGPYGFVMMDAEPLVFQPMRGSLGIFKAAVHIPERTR